MFKRKYFLILLAVGVIVSTILGCTAPLPTEEQVAEAPIEEDVTEPQEDEVVVESPEEDEPVEPPADEPVTIRYQDWRLAEEPSGSSLMGFVDSFMAENPNIKVELEPVSSGDKEKIFITQVQGGDPPDVVRVVTHGSAPFYAMGALRNIEDFVSAAGGDSYKDKFTKYLVDAGTFDGNMHCVPHEGDSFVLYINTRLWEEAGLDPNNPPQTFDELLDAFIALNKPSEDQYAFGMLGLPGSSPQWMQSFFLAFGSNYFNEDFTDTIIDSPEAKAAFKYYTDLFTEYNLVPPGPSDVGYSDHVALFAMEQVAAIHGPYATYGGILNANPDIEPYLKAIPFPGIDSYPGRTAGRGSILCIPAGSDHPEEAWELIQWLVNEDNQKAHFYDATMFPALKSANEALDFTGLDVAKVISEDSIPFAVSYPTLVEWPEAKAILEDMLVRTLLGEIDSDSAIDQAAEEIRNILSGE